MIDLDNLSKDQDQIIIGISVKTAIELLNKDSFETAKAKFLYVCIIL